MFGWEHTNSANSRPPSRDASSPPVTSPPAPADRDKNLDPAAYDNFQNTTKQQMPHRVEPYPMSSAQPQPAYPYAAPPAPSSKQRRSPYERRASPPPIATLPTHSGSPSPSASSLDRSAVSTPPVSAPGRRSPHPPHTLPIPPHHSSTTTPHTTFPAATRAATCTRPRPRLRNTTPTPTRTPTTRTAATTATPTRTRSTRPSRSPSPTAGTCRIPSRHHPQRSNGSAPGGGGAGVIQVVHTDDAATKLSDRVRRRCFNCCTTDTSTWRRSNLSPGKVLCNKCGLFERTHSRPRPEQFPHKRGPLASSTLRSRSPPQAQPYQTPAHYPPPALPLPPPTAPPTPTPLPPTAPLPPPTGSKMGRRPTRARPTPKRRTRARSCRGWIACGRRRGMGGGRSGSGMRGGRGRGVRSRWGV
ncbi:hypothetical protein B0H13DRAFT_1728851 [Mycena leptocephala]|nr:hypothetical protein B0H13DRAFT_1728851 [Mycena leptocephala]